jgi:hypothetical protein
VFAISERLGVDVREVIDWPVELLAAWLAFFKVKAEYESGG